MSPALIIRNEGYITNLQNILTDKNDFKCNLLQSYLKNLLKCETVHVEKILDTLLSSLVSGKVENYETHRIFIIINFFTEYYFQIIQRKNISKLFITLLSKMGLSSLYKTKISYLLIKCHRHNISKFIKCIVNEINHFTSQYFLSTENILALSTDTELLNFDSIKSIYKDGEEYLNINIIGDRIDTFVILLSACLKGMDDEYIEIPINEINTIFTMLIHYSVGNLLKYMDANNTSLPLYPKKYSTLMSNGRCDALELMCDDDFSQINYILPSIVPLLFPLSLSVIEISRSNIIPYLKTYQNYNVVALNIANTTYSIHLLKSYLNLSDNTQYQNLMNRKMDEQKIKYNQVCQRKTFEFHSQLLKYLCDYTVLIGNQWNLQANEINTFIHYVETVNNSIIVPILSESILNENRIDTHSVLTTNFDEKYNIMQCWYNLVNALCSNFNIVTKHHQPIIPMMLKMLFTPIHKDYICHHIGRADIKILILTCQLSFLRYHGHYTHPHIRTSIFSQLMKLNSCTDIQLKQFVNQSIKELDNGAHPKIICYPQTQQYQNLCCNVEGNAFVNTNTSEGYFNDKVNMIVNNASTENSYSDNNSDIDDEKTVSKVSLTDYQSDNLAVSKTLNITLDMNNTKLNNMEITMGQNSKMEDENNVTNTMKPKDEMKSLQTPRHIQITPDVQRILDTIVFE